MSKINAIKNSMVRATTVRTGKGISRIYHNTKHVRRIYTAATGFEMFLALQAVHNRWTFNTIIMTGLALYFSKKAVDWHNLKADITPLYQPIVDRAKQIYNR